MLKVNESAPIRLANAESQLRRRTAASVAPKPIACRRQKFNASASTIPARSTEQVRCKEAADSACRLRIINHGIPGATYRRHSADDCVVDGSRRRSLLRSAGHSDVCFCHTLHLPHRSRSEVSAAPFFVFQKSPRAGGRRGVPHVCAADSSRGLHVCPKPGDKYGEGPG